MLIKFKSYLTSKYALISILVLLYFIQLMAQIDSPRKVAVADSISYIVSGINLISEGHFTNPFGKPEVWFPPIYPSLIGLLVGITQIEPVFSARIISMAAGFISIILVYAIASKVWNNYCGLIAAILLLSNPLFQFISNYALSEVVASSFALFAFYFWLTDSTKTLRKNVLVAVFLAAATLTRPEYIILAVALPFWGFMFSAHAIKKKITSCLAFGSIFLLLITPYAFYLQDKTGVFTISNKSEVNIADGRSKYHSGPREIIDPNTFAIGYQSYPNDVETETKRYLTNVVAIWNGYKSTYTNWFVFLFFATVLYGFYRLTVEKQYKPMFGLLSGFAYLGILAFYSVYSRYLYGTIPILSLYSSYGIYSLLSSNNVFSYRSTGTLKYFTILVLLLGLTEGYTRYPRWELTREKSELEFIKEAGLQSNILIPDNCVIYGFGATFGYYAGCRRGRLTSDKLDLVLNYVNVDKQNDEAFMVFIERKNKPIHKQITLEDIENSSKLSLIREFSEKDTKIFLYKVN